MDTAMLDWPGRWEREDEFRYLYDKMVYCEMPELTMMHDHIECVFVKINCMDYMLIVGVVYRPPNSNTVDILLIMYMIYWKRLLTTLVVSWATLILILNMNYIAQQRNV